MSSNENSKRIAKNTLFLFIRMVLVLCVGLYTSRVVLATLGVEDFGIYNVVGSIVVLFSFFQQALNNATYRYLAFELGKNDIGQLKKCFSMAVNVHLILAFVVVVLCEIIGVWFLNNKLNIPPDRISAAQNVFHFSLIYFCIGIVQTPFNSAIIAHEKMNFYAYTSIVEVLLKLLIVFLLMLVSFDKLILYSMLLSVVAIIVFLWYVFQCRRMFEECKYHWVWDKSLCKGMLKYSGWSIVVNAVDVSVNQSILFFLNIFFGVVTNAAMGIANQVNGQLNNFLQTFTQSYNPQIIKSYAAGNNSYFMKLIFSTSKISYFLLLFAAVPVLLNIDFLLNLWLINPPPNASTFVILVVACSLVDAYSAPLWIGVHATGKLRTHQILMASIKILNIPLAYLLLSYGSPAWTVLALKNFINVTCSIVRPFYVKNLYGLPFRKYMLQVWCNVYLVTLIVIPVPYYFSSLMGQSWLGMLITTSLFAIVFIPVVYFIGLNLSERRILKQMLYNKIPFLKGYV